MLLERSQLDNLELLAKQVVEGFIIGLHKSPFHGFSVEFAEHRLYNNGDPLRHIDWRVYGRTDKMFIKRYEEETNLRCCLAIDTSSSMLFPQDKNKVNKLQFSCVAAASLLHLLKRQLDAAGLALFDDKLRYMSPVRSAQSHHRLLMHQLEETLKNENINNATNAANALHTIAEQMHKRSLIIIFSDMMDDPDHIEDMFLALQHLKFNKHEVILFHTLDGEKEVEFDFDNRPFEFVDMETGDKVRLQPQQVKDEYLVRMHEFRAMVENRCHQYKIDYVPVDLSEPVEQVLYAFLLKRNKLL
ncbi:MAG: DUF58 domain-containing protein [Chitinophagaceae bacterium]|nr:DUF58 domain-containing protein [Chitinophagaceae bacterium]MCB9046316.1 DUF58 domain-containing protein [Chitinophagales bacterium]